VHVRLDAATGLLRDTSLSYGDAGRKNLLDVYHRRPGTAKKPVLIHLHGGALFMGRKNRERFRCCTGSPARVGCASARTTGCVLP
jgi:acetyl esterase/lipase